MADLRTDYKDDILDLTQNTQRKYRMITNDDDTVSFEDVTAYSQVGDSFGAADVNTITNALNNTEGSVRYNAETDMIQIVDADGVWHDWKKGGLGELVLFDYGDACTEVSGGWQSTSYKPSEKNAFNGYGPTLTFNPNDMTLSLVGEKYYIGTVFNGLSIDLTDYDKLCVEVEAPKVGYAAAFIMPCVVSNKTDTYTYDSSTVVTGDNEYTGIIEVNISNVIGGRYIGLCQQNADASNVTGKTYTVAVKKIWVE